MTTSDDVMTSTIDREPPANHSDDRLASWSSPTSSFAMSSGVTWQSNASGLNDTVSSTPCVVGRCSYMDARRLIDLLDFYLIPVIICVGTVGNLLSFLVFTATYLRRLSSSVYLAALAVVDTVFLVTLLLNWLPVIGVKVHNQPGLCQLFVYATYVTSFLSVWYVACFSVERYLIIQFPLKRHVFCRPRRAKTVVCGMALVAMVLYNFAVWTSTTDLHNDQMTCQVRSEFEQLVTSLNNADTLITLVVPSALIIFSNVRISFALTQFYRTRKSFDEPITRAVSLPSTAASTTGSIRHSLRRQRSSGATQPTEDIDQHSSFNRLQLKVTKMLLMVSIVFLLLNSPSHIIRVYIFVKKLFDSDYEPDYSLWLAQNYTMHLFYANFASNFALYNASGTTFRRAMIRLGRRFLVRIRVCCSTSSSVMSNRPWKQAQRLDNARRSLYAARGIEGLRPCARIENNGCRTSAAVPIDVADKAADHPEARSCEKAVPAAKKISLSRLKIFGSTSVDNIGECGSGAQKASHDIPMLPCQTVVAVLETKSTV